MKLTPEERLEHQKASSKKWYEKTKEIRRQYGRDYYAARKDDKALWCGNARKHNYGLTNEEWEKKFEAQGRACACCGSKEPNGNKGRWATDHNHSTGKVRDILCNPCNSGLGYFKESVEKLLKAVAYLEKHQ